MKIRAGFVTNSSSTSFLIISQDDLNPSDFLSLMGVDKASPLVDLFLRLFEDLLEGICSNVDFAHVDPNAPVEKWFSHRPEGMSSWMIEKLKDAQRRGLKAYYGFLDSESDSVQMFFCTDSFEAESDKVYINALNCIW